MLCISYCLFRECLAFATEPVFTSLGHFLQDNPSSNSSSLTQSQALDEVEVKYGLLQVLVRMLPLVSRRSNLHV